MTYLRRAARRRNRPNPSKPEAIKAYVEGSGASAADVENEMMTWPLEPATGPPAVTLEFTLTVKAA